MRSVPRVSGFARTILVAHTHLRFRGSSCRLLNTRENHRDMFRAIYTILSMFAALAMATPAGADAVTQVSPHHRYMYASLLIKEDTQSVRLGAKALINDGAVSVEFADMAAKILTEYAAGARPLIDIDTVRWLIRVIANSHSQRYQHVLQPFVGRRGRLGADATAAISGLTHAGETFKNTDVDFAAIQSQLDLLRIQSKKVEEAKLSDARDGVCLSEAAARLGYPDEILVVERPRHVTHGAVVALQDVMFEYSQTGVIEFARSASDWCAVTISLWEPSFGSMGDAMHSYFVRGFLSNNATFLRNAARRGYQIKLTDERQLDIAAFRLRRDMKTNDPTLQDALKWVSHLLRLSRNQRYFELMQVLSNEGATKDLRKHGVEGMAELAPASGS